MPPARSDGGSNADDAPHQGAGDQVHHPVPGVPAPHSPMGHKTEVSKEPEQTEAPQLPVKIVNLVGPDAYDTWDTILT